MTTCILRGHRGGVDFAEPVPLSQKQRATFFAFLGKMFVIVDAEEIETTDFRGERLGAKLFSRGWSSRELRILLLHKENDEVCELLGRTWMSVDIKRGQFIPEFLEWAHRTGSDITQGNLRRLIEEFLKEKLLEREHRHQKRARERAAIRKLQNELERHRNLIRTTEIQINAGRMELQPRIREITERIRQIKRALSEER